MAKVVSLIVVQMTADVRFAGTDDGFNFEVIGLPTPIDRRFPGLPSNERERGNVDAYTFNIEKLAVEVSLFQPGVEFRIRARGNDAWLPAAVHIFAMTEDGEMRRLVDRRGGFDWLSTDESEGPDVLTLPSGFGGLTPI
jgi:hypothetical protein